MHDKFKAKLVKQERALEIYFDALKSLYEEKILVNKQSFTNQIGEWLVETIFSGTRAKNAIQKGWDVKVGEKKIQIKTHSKASTNKAKHTTITKSSLENVDELIIIVFSSNYKIDAFYIIPCEDATKYIEYKNKKTPREREQLKWSSLKAFKVDLDTLPMQNVISIFK
jgi:hypothetical protein